MDPVVLMMVSLTVLALCVGFALGFAVCYLGANKEAKKNASSKMEDALRESRERLIAFSLSSDGCGDDLKTLISLLRCPLPITPEAWQRSVIELLTRIAGDERSSVHLKSYTLYLNELVRDVCLDVVLTGNGAKTRSLK